MRYAHSAALGEMKSTAYIQTRSLRDMTESKDPSVQLNITLFDWGSCFLEKCFFFFTAPMTETYHLRTYFFANPLKKESYYPFV